MDMVFILPQTECTSIKTLCKNLILKWMKKFYDLHNNICKPEQINQNIWAK
jgi:hypothetical protein